jgi:transcriptional regulator with XRE-family HTH domain
MTKKTIGERLREFRRAAGMSQEGLARAADVSTSTVVKIERDAVDPSWSTVEKLAATLGVPVGAFAGESSAKPKKGDHGK